VKTPSHSSYASDESLQFVVPFLKPSKNVTGNEECLPSKVNDGVNEEVIVGYSGFDVCEENALFSLVGWVAFKLETALQSCDSCVSCIINKRDDLGLSDRTDIQLTKLKSLGALDYGLTILSDSFKNCFLFGGDVQATLPGKCNSLVTDSAIPK
jgi:hypothetical protein